MARKRKGQDYIIPDDGIIDEMAVELVASGQRSVRLTDAERLKVIEKIIQRGASAREMALAIVTSPKMVERFVGELGYEFVHVSGWAGKQVVILPCDRPKQTLTVAAFGKRDLDPGRYKR